MTPEDETLNYSVDGQQHPTDNVHFSSIITLGMSMDDEDIVDEETRPSTKDHYPAPHAHNIAWMAIQLARDDGLAGSFYLLTIAKYTIDVDSFFPPMYFAA